MSTIPLSELVFDDGLFPRQHVDDHHVVELARAMEGGSVLPPIVVCRATRKIVDGVHRYHAALRRGEKKISAVLKHYKNETERFRDAVMLNSGQGLRLGTHDEQKVVEIGESLGLKEIDLAGILRTSISHLRVIKMRYATVEEAIDGVAKLRRVALKASTRHLSGHSITAEQDRALTSSPGTSYLLVCRQLCDALAFDLLPAPDSHTTLWAELDRLRSLLEEKLPTGQDA